MDEIQHWNQFRQGDLNSFEWIYRKYANLMLRYGYAFDHDVALVEDCMHELFVELWEKRSRIGDTTSVKNYLLASLKRKIWSKQKKQKRRNIKSLEDEQFIDFELSIEEKWILSDGTNEQNRILSNSLEQLSTRQKELLYLKYHEGLDYDSICEIMELNYQSARNLLSTALKKLKNLMLPILIFILFLL